MKRLVLFFALLLCVSGCGDNSKSEANVLPNVIETYNNVSYALNQDLTFNVIYYYVNPDYSITELSWNNIVISDFYYVVKNSTSSSNNTFYVCEGELYYLVVYYVQK